MSSTEMKSYLSLIPISAKVRRRQNRMTILCIVIAVFLVSAIFSVADMMLRTQMNRAAGKDGSWHLQIAGITQSQAEQLAQQPDVVCAGAGAVFNEGGEEDYRLNGKRVVLYGCDAQFLRVNRSAAFEGTFPEQDGEVLLGKGAARIFGVAIGDSVTLKLPDGQNRTLTVTGIGGVDESYYEMQFALVDIYLPQETFESLLTGQGEALPQTVYDLQYTSAAKAAKALPQLQQQYGEDAVHENLNVMGSAGQSNSTAFRTVYKHGGRAVCSGVACRCADDLRYHEQQCCAAHPFLWYDALSRNEQTAGRSFCPDGSTQLVQDCGPDRPCSGDIFQLGGVRRTAVRHWRRVCDNASITVEYGRSVRRCCGGRSNGVAGGTGSGQAGCRGPACGGGFRE